MTNSNPEAAGLVGNVLVPVPDVDRARRFYGDVFGLTVKFADGDRYVALDGGTTTVALVSPAEDVTSGRVAASFKASDVELTLQAVRVAGGRLVMPAETGPHEIRAVVADPAGNLSVVYAPRAPKH